MDRPFGMLRSVTHGVDAPRSIKKGTIPRIWRFAAPYRRGLLALPQLMLPRNTVETRNGQSRPLRHQVLGGSHPGGGEIGAPRRRRCREASRARTIETAAFCQSGHWVNLIKGVCCFGCVPCASLSISRRTSPDRDFALRGI